MAFSIIKTIPGNSIQRPDFLCSNRRSSACSGVYRFPVSRKGSPVAFDGRVLLHSNVVDFSNTFCGLKYWILKKFKLEAPNKKIGLCRESKRGEVQENDQFRDQEVPLSSEGNAPEEVSSMSLLNESIEDSDTPIPQFEESSIPSYQPVVSQDHATATRPSTSEHAKPYNIDSQGGREPSLCIAVVGVTGELARTKIFPALFALYYSGHLPENVGIFGYSRKHMTDEDLRSVIASTLTCRVDHQ